jgi:hypothetical protein
METVVIAGGTGMIGGRLSRDLIASGYRVIILTRNAGLAGARGSVEYSYWNPEKALIDRRIISEADHIVNLAGAFVMAQRWTPEYKKKILESRTVSTRLLAEVIQKTPNRVRTVINGSAIGWYCEDRNTHYSFVETDPADEGYLGATCKAWEESIPDRIGDTQVCRLRTGIVLGREGGFLRELELPVKLGIAPIISKGKQVISWIHIQDLCGIIIFLMQKGLGGNYNAVAPHPSTNKEITLCYARKKKGKFIIPIHVPAILLTLMLGERAIEILKSTRVSCEKIMKAGFQFTFPTLEEAMKDITGN